MYFLHQILMQSRLDQPGIPVWNACVSSHATPCPDIARAGWPHAVFEDVEKLSEISFDEFVVEALTVSNTKNEKRRGHKNTDVQPDVLEVPMWPRGGSRRRGVRARIRGRSQSTTERRSVWMSAGWHGRSSTSGLLQLPARRLKRR